MPTPLIKKLADENKVTVQTVEKYWDEAKDILFKQGKKEDDKYFYATVVKIVKNKLGINEMLLSIEEFEMACDVVNDINKQWLKAKTSAKLLEAELVSNKLYTDSESLFLVNDNDVCIAVCDYDSSTKSILESVQSRGPSKGNYKDINQLIISRMMLIDE